MDLVLNNAKYGVGENNMEYIQVTKENIDKEHICCAIGSAKDIQVISKKNWLLNRFDEGLVFLKGNERGKCFIQYVPGENAWAPVEAAGYMYIDCLWVSGQFKGHGYSDELLDQCINDSRSKGKKGLVILGSAKKKGFLSDPGYIKHRGFEVCDTAEPYFELYYLPFEDTNEKPLFKKHIHEGYSNHKGLELYYSNQCPFTAKYVPLLQKIAEDRNVTLKCTKLETTADAQNAPCPFTTFCLFNDGKLITHEILSEKKFGIILDSLNL